MRTLIYVLLACMPIHAFCSDWKADCEKGTPNACVKYVEQLYGMNEKEKALQIAAKGCEANDYVLCKFLVHYPASIALKTKGLKPFQKECDKGNVDACFYSIRLFEELGKDEEAAKRRRTFCGKSPEVCVKYAKDTLGYGGDIEAMLGWIQPACDAKHVQACDLAKELNRNKEKHCESANRLFLKVDPEMKAIREKFSSLPIDYDLKDKKWNWEAMEKEIDENKPLNKRIHFPITRCGAFLPSDNPVKWPTIVECGGGSERVWYKIVVGKTLSETLPKKFRITTSKPKWATGTVVELRGTGVVPALVIVTDKDRF